MTPNEQELWRQIRTGQKAAYVPCPRDTDRTSPCHDTNPILWSEVEKKARIISANFIKALLMEDRFTKRITHKGVRIIGAWIPEELDLESMEIKNELWLDQCLLSGGVNLECVKASKYISIEKTIIDGQLKATHARFESDLNLRGSLLPKTDLSQSFVGGRLDLDGVACDGDLRLDESHIGSSVIMSNGIYFGDVSLCSVTILNSLILESSCFLGPLNLNTLKVDNSIEIIARHSLRECTLTP